MDKKYLEKLCEEKIKVKLNLKSNRFYTGVIIEVGGSSIVFLDKYNNEIVIDINSISYIIPINGGDIRNGS